MKNNPHVKDITGVVFNDWTAVSFIDVQGVKSRWLARCVCGTERIMFSSIMQSGLSKNCGCKRGKHRHTAPSKGGVTPTYSTWSNMVARCTQPSSPAFKHYQKRGIALCDRWRSFENFLADMGERPTGMTLDRKENDGNYEPGNCRWSTKVEQANNRVTNILFEYKGETFTLANLARHTGVSKELLRCRLVRNKGHRTWTVEQAVHEPNQKGARFDTPARK